MFRGILFALLVLIPQLGWAQRAITISPSGLEGTLTFQASVVLPNGMADTEENVVKLINLQTEHLLSLFELPQFAEMNGIKPQADLGFMGLGALEAYKIVSETKTMDGVEITYRARNRVVVMRRVLEAGQSRTLKIILPHDPVEIYAKPCTDQQYYEKEYFFYYWNPFLPACQARLTGKNKVEEITATLEALTPPSAGITPDYQALSEQIRRRGELHVSLLFGFDLTHSNPKDEGWQSYNYFLKYFARQGFVTDRRRNTPTGPFAELIRPGDGQAPTVHISMSLSASDVNSPIVFSRRAREAYETSDIVMYIGHSGLGGNLDLSMIERLSSPDPDHPVPIHFPNAYQVFYFDSCGSYYFYSQQYALARRGVHHADIVSNGTAAYFESQNGEIANFLSFFVGPKNSTMNASTWLQILGKTETAGDGLTYLVNVSPVR